MTRRTKTMILSICLIAALMLTACQTHVDSDPWPASDGVTATDAPETTQDAGRHAGQRADPAHRGAAAGR